MDIPPDLILKDPIINNYHLKAPIFESDAEYIITVDEALALAGNNEFYQKRTTFFLALQWLVLAFIIQGQSFLFLPPNFVCPDSSNVLQECSETSACRYQQPFIDPLSKNTITHEFSLYCARGYYKSMTQMLFFTGSNVAVLIFSFISDLKGRKSTLIFTYGLGAVSLLISSFAVNWYMLMLFLVIAGMGINPFTALSFILLNESAGDDFRQTASISLLATYGLGQLFFILLAYMFPDWQILVLYCIAIPLALQIGTFIWIYESPKFLLSKKEFKKAKEIIYKIAKVNKRTLGLFTFKEQKEYENEIKNDLLEKVKEITTDDFSCLKLRDITDDEFLNATLKNAVKSNDVSVNVENPDFNNQGRFNSTFNEIIKNHIDHNDLFLFHKFPMFRRELKRHHRIYTVLDLLRYASQLKISLILCIVHFSIYLTYYGLIFSLETIGGDVYISALLQTSAELLAYLSINFIIGHIKRRIMLPFCLLAQSLSCLLTLALMNNSQILILAMISRFFIAMALSIATVYTAELYPTTIRSLGIGFTSFVGKFGCAFAPLLGKMFQYTLMLHPMVSYGIVGTFAGFLAIFLKETLGLPLEEEIPELFVEKTERNKNKI